MDVLPVGGRDGVVFRVKGSRRRLYPSRPGRDQILFLAVRKLGRKGAAPDHRPAGLVIMVVGWVDNRQRYFSVALQHAGRGCDAGGAAADNDHVKPADAG